MADVPSVSIIQRFHGLVSRGLSFGRSFILRLPPIKLLLPFLPKTRDLSTPPHHGSTFDLILSDPSPSRIVIISLSYTPSPDGTGAWGELYGPRNDFILMLKHYGYLHGDTSGRFTLLNDFDATFKDSAGVEELIPKTDTSKKAIENAIKKSVSATNKSGSTVFYFAGHGALVEEEGPLESSTAAKALAQAIIVEKGERIYGPELRSWLSAGADPGASVTAIFDTCTCAGILGLSYRYEYRSKRQEIASKSGTAD
ncbi:hypothetical protein FRC05_003750 [Tulasnella sp. 425]|nr:hypothetical protein FRC05_003750 [Tulasnella sp. 425]